MTAMDCDIAIAGAGIAGASVAAHLAPHRRVILIEREEVPGYHSTGRSAALFSESYGNAVVRALSRASRDFFYAPPAGFSDYPLVKPRGALHVGRRDEAGLLKAFLANEDMQGCLRPVSAEEAVAMSPLLRPEAAAAGGAYEADAADVDVHALHQGYLRQFRHAGGQLLTSAGIVSVERTGDAWLLHTETGTFRASILVNAAGAWADQMAAVAGAKPLGITPCRRTAVLVEPPAGLMIDSWPMTLGIDESYYFKPDAGLVLVTPADETPIEPCDVQPDEYDVAVAVARLEEATTLSVTRIRRKWAGLRSFAPDRTLVIGFDPVVTGFFWLAGQGGYGIQTAPAASQLAAALLTDAPLTGALEGFDAALVSPARFRMS